MTELFWLLLPVAAASGWWWAKRDTLQTDAHNKRVEYFKGLNYLLNDKPDQAIEVFSRIAESDGDIVETHLTLGNLFRRRGEVDRAIHIHHNLTNRSNLSSGQRNRAMLELAEDYMRAGLFDRAEGIYRILVDKSEHIAVSLNRLIDIYEQEKDWQQALVHCDRLEQQTGQVRKVEGAQYCCELAEEALRREDIEQAQRFLQHALVRDANCARASMLQGRIALQLHEYQAGIAAFKAVERQNPSYFIEVLELLSECYIALEQEHELLAYLHEVQQRDHSGRLTAALALLIDKLQGIDAAIAFLEQELKTYPTFLGLRYLVECRLRQQHVNNDLDMVYRTSKKMLSGPANYRCDHCGFVGMSMHWHCPGCQCWDTIKPLPDMLCKAES